MRAKLQAENHEIQTAKVQPRKFVYSQWKWQRKYIHENPCTCNENDGESTATKVHVFATKITAKIQPRNFMYLQWKWRQNVQRTTKWQRKSMYLQRKWQRKCRRRKSMYSRRKWLRKCSVQTEQRKSRILGDEKADDTNRLTTQMSVFRQLVRNDKSFIFIAWVSQCLHEFYQDWPVDGKGPFFSVLSFYDHVSVLQGGPSIRLALNMNFHAWWTSRLGSRFVTGLGYADVYGDVGEYMTASKS